MLFDKVCEHLNLLEKDYFGITYRDVENQKVKEHKWCANNQVLWGRKLAKLILYLKQGDGREKYANGIHIQMFKHHLNNDLWLISRL